MYSESRREPTIFPFVNKYFLIAEDNVLNQQIIKRLFLSMGCKNLEFANNGLEAFNLSKVKDFDAILMDVMMPEMSGIESTIKIRNEINKERQPVIIALTADVVRGTEESCLEAGMNGFLTKPISKPLLASTLTKFFSLNMCKLL